MKISPFVSFSKRCKLFEAFKVFFFRIFFLLPLILEFLGFPVNGLKFRLSGNFSEKFLYHLNNIFSFFKISRIRS